MTSEMSSVDGIEGKLLAMAVNSMAPVRLKIFWSLINSQAIYRLSFDVLVIKSDNFSWLSQNCSER